MVRILGIVAIVALLAFGGIASASSPTAALKAQLRTQKLKTAKVTGQLAAANREVVALKAQLSMQVASGLNAILAGSPDDLWTAITAIWNAFPSLPAGTLCGYDKDQSTTTGTGFNIAHFTFTDYTGCAP